MEFSALSNWARLSSEGKSPATAIMIPKIQETNASTERPRKTSAKRSFLSFGRRLGGGGGVGAVGEGGSPPSGTPPSGPSPLTLPGTGRLRRDGGVTSRARPAGERRRGRLILGGIWS